MFHRLPRERDRESLRPLPLASAGFRVLHLKHSVLLAKLLAPQLGQIQSPGRGSLPPPLPLSPLPPFSPLSPPRSSRSSPRACFSRRFLNQSGVPLSELLSLAAFFRLVGALSSPIAAEELQDVGVFFARGGQNGCSTKKQYTKGNSKRPCSQIQISWD